LSEIVEKSLYLSKPTMKVNAGFGFSDDMRGVGVASGVGIDTGSDADFRTRRPDCPMTANTEVNKTVAKQIA